VTVDLAAASGEVTVQWLHPVEGTFVAGEPVEGRAKRTFQSPISGDAVLHLKTQTSGEKRRQE